MAAHHPKANERSASTTFTQVPDRMRRSRREGPSKAGAKRTFRGLARRNPRDPLTITVRYRGGAEGWWLIEARGRAVAFPATSDLHWVMTQVNQSFSYTPPK